MLPGLAPYTAITRRMSFSALTTPQKSDPRAHSLGQDFANPLELSTRGGRVGGTYDPCLHIGFGGLTFTGDGF